MDDDSPAVRASTRAVHAGHRAAEHLGALSVPIYQASAFERPVVLDGGYDYSRIANPTRTALEESLAALEGGTAGFAFASGMAAATTTVLALCEAGDHVVIPDNTYGGTWDLFSRVLPRWGLEFDVVDLADPAALERALKPHTTLIWAETPSNPSLKITDIAAVADIAHAHGVRLLVDNTFGSPVLQQPIALGADAVMHSTTKYLSGHSDVTGGAVVTSDTAIAEALKFHSGALGTMGQPFDSWLVLRGIKTLPIRMAQVSRSALAIAQYLEAHPRVHRVHYPGLPNDPGHDVAKRQMSDFGGVVSFEVDDPAAVCAATKVFTLAVSLGGIESLIQNPGRMTHCTTPGGPIRIPETLIRLSIGLEDVDDLLADLDAGLRC
ncbi:trans-sulfuration enzyme family protein [Cryptosporangium sp. NPDC048952]|uniref:trans-sulfuration enzyme family protein n=1 Tax=Cryptosporangium sp. NPDC048952 TaxID=3363961 RepID=UPI00372005E1